MNGKWEMVKNKYNGTEMDVVFDVASQTDSNNPKSSCHWWLDIPEEYREGLHGIRAELGLDRPYWGLHLSIGYANDLNKELSKYAHRNALRYGK